MQITHNHKSKHKRQHTTTPLNRQQTPDKQSLFHSWTQPLTSLKQTTNIHTPITRPCMLFAGTRNRKQKQKMGIRVKQFKEIDYPQPHTGKGEHNANTNHTKSRHKKNRTEEKRNRTIWKWEEEGQSKRKTCTKEHSMNKT